MAKKAKGARKRVRKAAPVDGGDVPIVDLLRLTLSHLAWLDWLGRQFDPDTLIQLPALDRLQSRRPPPPEPGECGIEGSEFTTGDLVELVDTAGREVATVLDRLIGGDLVVKRAVRRARR